MVTNKVLCRSLHVFLYKMGEVEFLMELLEGLDGIICRGNVLSCLAWSKFSESVLIMVWKVMVVVVMMVKVKTQG